MLKTLCFNKCSMNYFYIIPSLYIKYNFYRLKPVDPSLAASEARQMLSPEIVGPASLVHALTVLGPLPLFHNIT